MPNFPNLISGIEIAPDGAVWIAGARDVARFQDGAWTVWNEGNGFSSFLAPNAIAIEERSDGSYAVWVTTSGFVAVFEDGAWREIEGSFIGSRSVDAIEDLAVTTSFQDGIDVFQGGAVIDVGRDDGMSSNDVRAVAIDDLGRVWAATAYGVTVFEDNVARTYRIDNSGLIDNNVYTIVVVGQGPQLPADAPEPWAGLSGLAVDQAGNPIVGAAVEVCVEDLDDEFEGDSPCALDPYARTTVTDDEGRFEILSLRAGRYVMSFQLPGASTWTYFVDSSRAVRYSALEPGVIAQLGALTFQTG